MSKGGSTKRVGTSCRILYAEDDPGLREGMASLLSRVGEVTAVASGAEAFAAAVASDQPFDVVVTDGDMPGGDGVTLATELRRVGRYGSAPIFLFSGRWHDELPEGVKAAGMTYLHKSQIKELFDAVKTAAESSPPQAELE